MTSKIVAIISVFWGMTIVIDRKRMARQAQIFNKKLRFSLDLRFLQVANIVTGILFIAFGTWVFLYK